MAIQSQPSRISEPFAGSGTKNTIPATNATPSASQAASWASGFPPECSQPISAGGCPVPRNDVNGVLNQISQDYVFRQDGGIWAWSALADYDTQRMVRGSDGLLYWSVAQSGPGFGAGAVDPTTDDGSYWSSPALRTMPLADKSAMGATTEWVKDLAVAPVYLDPAGSDSNNGMTAATAVQTFAKAVDVAKGISQNEARFIVASGAYADGPSVSNIHCLVSLQGPVTCSNDVSASMGGFVVIQPAAGVSNATLTVNGRVLVLNAGTIVFGVELTVSSSSGRSVYIQQNSCVYMKEKCTAEAPVDNPAISLTGGSSLYVDKALVTITDGASPAIWVLTSSYFFGGENSSIEITKRTSGSTYGLMVQDFSYARVYNVKVVNSTNGYPIRAEFQSFIHLYGIISIASSTSGAGVSALGGSQLAFGVGATVSVNAGLGATNFYNIAAIYNSVVSFDGTTSVNLYLYTGSSVVLSQCSSFIYFRSTGLKISGTSTSSFVIAEDKSLIYIFNDCTISTDSATGKRYSALYNSVIDTRGGGANRIPGSIAGTVDNNASFYF